MPDNSSKSAVSSQSTISWSRCFASRHTPHHPHTNHTFECSPAANRVSQCGSCCSRCMHCGVASPHKLWGTHSVQCTSSGSCRAPDRLTAAQLSSDSNNGAASGCSKHQQAGSASLEGGREVHGTHCPTYTGQSLVHVATSSSAAWAPSNPLQRTFQQPFDTAQTQSMHMKRRAHLLSSIGDQNQSRSHAHACSQAALVRSLCKGAGVTPARRHQVRVCMPHGQAVAAMVRLPVNRKGAVLHLAAGATTDCGNHQGSHTQQATQNGCQDQLFLHPTSLCSTRTAQKCSSCTEGAAASCC